MWVRVKSVHWAGGSDDVVGTRRETHQKLTEGIRSLSGVRRELAKGIRGLSGVRQKLAEGIRSFLGVRRELARMALEVHRKKTKRLIERSSGVIEKFIKSQEGLIGLDVCWETSTGRSYIPVFQIRMEKMKEVKRPL
ncbi:hypothetical protein B296_00018994 [Ensete ventricosum]|uniref:Uncharacterized protein n=1 Tax=Ensete ventricosum TaxID=4639 RepID=A0A426ZAB3_ENSVE|nr:hypothetical protein B296_00018994 [Ensete ventricosum]